MNSSVKSKYVYSASLLILASVVVKIISAIYKIPLTTFIGATGRGYFACAYNIFMPIHIITMGSLPIAMSQLISRYNSVRNKVMIRSLQISANKMCFFVGMICTFCVVVFAYPYCFYIAKSPNSLLTVLALVPCVLFSTMTASYRGYFEGFLNMVPTSTCQTIEALVKALFGLLFAKLSMAYLYNAYINKTLDIFANVTNDTDAMSIIYPITAAFAMLGVSLGAIISYLYLVAYSKNHCRICVYVSRSNVKLATKELTQFSFALMLSCVVQSIFQFFDTASVQLALTSYNVEQIKKIFSECLILNNVSENDLYTYCYGILNAAIDFKNIIPGITMAIGICAVPSISSAYHKRNKYRLNALSNIIFKYTVIISTFCGAFIGVESESILNLLYANNKDIVVGANLLVKAFSFTIVSNCLASSSIFCVQAIAKPKKTILPFIVGGIVRTILNLILVSNERFNLFGTVISNFVGFLIIAVWNLLIYSAYSKTKISIVKCFIVPLLTIFISAISYNFIAKYLLIDCNEFMLIVLKGLTFLINYLFWSIILQNLDIKELKTAIIWKKHS